MAIGGVFLHAGLNGKNWLDRKSEVQIENMRRMATIFNARNVLDAELTRRMLKLKSE